MTGHRDHWHSQGYYLFICQPKQLSHLLVVSSNVYSAASLAVAPRRMNLTTIARQMKENDSFTKTWFSDISTYPIMAICGGACMFAGSYIGYKFFTSPDVCYTKERRGAEIRWWGDDKANLRLNK